MSPRILRRFVTLGLGLALCGGLLAPAWADQEPDERAPISLRLSPAVLDVPHVAGLSRHELRVDNTGSRPIRVQTDTAEFTVTPEGVTQFLGPEEVGAASWVDIETSEFELDPDERRDVEVTVDVPEDAEPGERYVSVIFTVPGTDGEGNITVTHRVAVKLYIAVPGQQIHHLEFDDLAAPRLVDSSSATFELTLHNRGNVHRRFENPEQLAATSGGDEFLFENFTILGDSTRVVEAVWPNPPPVCWCTVEVETDDGRGNLITASTRVVMFPLRITLAILGLTAGLAMLLAARRRRQAARLEQQLEEARQQGAQSAAPPTAAPQAAPTPTVVPPASGAIPSSAPAPSPNTAAPTRPPPPPSSTPDVSVDDFWIYDSPADAETRRDSAMSTEDGPKPPVPPDQDREHSHPEPPAISPVDEPANKHAALDTSFFTAHGERPRRSRRRSR